VQIQCRSTSSRCLIDFITHWRSAGEVVLFDVCCIKNANCIRCASVCHESHAPKLVCFGVTGSPTTASHHLGEITWERSLLAKVEYSNSARSVTDYGTLLATECVHTRMHGGRSAMTMLSLTAKTFFLSRRLFSPALYITICRELMFFSFSFQITD
jgi:hypothetical protein